MVMTDDELIASYRGCKNPKKQIVILAQLNGCDSKDIRNRLKELGEYVPVDGRYKAAKPKNDIAQAIRDAQRDEALERKEEEKPNLQSFDLYEGSIQEKQAKAAGIKLSKAERLLKAVKEDKEEAKKVFEEAHTHYIPETIREILEEKIIDLNSQIAILKGQRKEIEDYLGWN